MNQQEENVSLEVCNLVSRGMSLADARKAVAAKEKAQAAAAKMTEAAASIPQTVEAAQAALTQAGVEFHPSMKLGKLQKLFTEWQATQPKEPAAGE